jgi:hypothetical protein
MVPKLVQALILMYYEIFEALVVGGGILLPKPFLDLGFGGVIRWTSNLLSSDMFFQFAKHLQDWQFPSVNTMKAEVQKWLWEQDIFHCQGFENLIVHYDRCLNKFWVCVEKQRTNIQTCPCAFLAST